MDMASLGNIEITVGDINDLEALVYARYIAPRGAVSSLERITIRGTLRGPNCEFTRTLPAVFKFRDVPSESAPTAEAVVTDPCSWTAELPHLYQCDVVAEQGGCIVAEYHGPIGFRRK